MNIYNKIVITKKEHIMNSIKNPKTIQKTIQKTIHKTIHKTIQKKNIIKNQKTIHKTIQKKNLIKNQKTIHKTIATGGSKGGIPLYRYQKLNHYAYQCGPFAIYNLLLKHKKYCKLTKIIKLCKANNLNGTICKNMNSAIIKINKICDINIQSITPTFDTICDIIKNKGSVIVLFHWQDATASSGEHYVLIESLSNYKFKVINYSFNEEIKYITSRNLKTMLLYHKNEEFNEVYPKIWGVKKRF